MTDVLQAQRAQFNLYPFTLPLARPYGWAKGAPRNKEGVLVECVLEDGTCGWGEVTLPPGERALFPDIQRWSKIWIATIFSGSWQTNEALSVAERAVDWEVALRVRAAIVNSWLFALSEKEQRGVGDLLSRLTSDGATFGAAAGPSTAEPSTVRVNGFIELSSEEGLLQRAAWLVSQGIDTLKLKGGLGFKADLERMATLRRIYPTIKLRFDPNGCYRESDYQQHREEISVLGLQYIEEPIAYSLSNAALFAQKFPDIPTAWDHWVTVPEPVRSLQDLVSTVSGGCTVILKVPFLGGLDQAWRCINFLRQKEVPAVVTGGLETLVGIRAAAEAASWTGIDLAHGLMLWDFFNPNTHPCPQISAGTITLPVAAGAPYGTCTKVFSKVFS